MTRIAMARFDTDCGRQGIRTMKTMNYLKTLICVAASVALIGCSGTRYDRSTGQYIDDKATSSRVKSALAKDPMVKASEIHVQSFRGNIHLTGFVDHPSEKERASQVARNTEGVGWFKNDILVKDSLPGESQRALGQQMDEPAGTGQSRESMKAGRQTEWQKGSLDPYDPANKIILRGTVASEEQKRSIENSVKAIPGVGEVENQLEVQDQ